MVRCFCILGRNRNLCISSCFFGSTTRPQSTLILKCETPQKILSCMGYTGIYLSSRQPQRQIGVLHLDLQLKAEDMMSLIKQTTGSVLNCSPQRNDSQVCTLHKAKTLDWCSQFLALSWVPIIGQELNCVCWHHLPGLNHGSISRALWLFRKLSCV